MELLSGDQIDRILSVADALRLNRGWVIVPLTGAEVGREIVMPDGKLLISAPGGARFESWFTGLRDRLAKLDLSRTHRADQLESDFLPSPPRPASAEALPAPKSAPRPHPTPPPPPPAALQRSGGRRRGDPRARPEPEAAPVPELAASSGARGPERQPESKLLKPDLGGEG